MAINPLQQPINYAVEVQSPFEAALGGVKLGAGLEEIQVARQKRAMEAQQLQAAQAQQAQFRSGLNAFFAKPAAERTFDELQPLLIGANKQQFDALKLVGEQMGAEKLNSSKKFTSQVLLAFEANPETAKTILQERINAETDPGQKRAYQTVLEIANQDPNQAARLVETLGAGTFGPEWFKGIEDVRKARREEAESVPKLMEAQAEARVAAGTVESRIAKAAEAAKPAPGFAIIPEAERVRLGLPAGVYQQNLGTKEIKPVSKEPLVSVSVGQQGQRDMLAMKELDVPRAQEFSAAAASARTLARDSRVIADLLRGKGGGTTVKLTSDFAKTLGFETDTVRANDLANSLAIRGATQLRPPGSGSTSDIEFKAFVSAFPSLANSEGGRDLMAKYAEAFATRSAKLADHARKLIREDKYTEEEIARFDTSLGSILGQDFYSGARVRAPAAPAAPAPAASAPPTSGTLTPAEQAELQQLRSRFGRVGQ
jgi:hypothetical protein